MMKLLTSYILFLVAIVLLLVVGIVSFLNTIIYSLITGYASTYFLNIALSIDQLGNVLIAPMANRLLIKKGAYQFGHIDETISSVLGKNQRDETLKMPGKALCAILDWIDPNHCYDAIDNTIVWA